MNFITPKIINSPTGQPTRPVMKSYIRGGKKVTEAHYTDPSNGTFFFKGTVKVEDNQKSN